MTFATPLALLLFIPLAALVVWTWRTGYISLSPRRGRLALGVRLALIAAIVLTLAGASLQLSQQRQAVVFVADLSASDAGSSTSIKNLINNALQQRGGGNLAGVVSVGREAQVEQPVTGLGRLDAFQAPVNPDYTNLEGGLDLGNAILPTGYRKRVVLISDGQQNVGDALAAARLLHVAGVRVDVAPVKVTSGPEVLVDNVNVQTQLRSREQFPLTITLRSTVATKTGLDVFLDRKLVLSKQVSVQPGINRYVYNQPALKPGFHTFQVHITPTVDTVGENNTGSAFTSVQGPAHVLVIAAARLEADNVLASLRDSGIQADFQSPGDVTPTLGYLQRYAGVVIVDTAADVLGPDLMQQLVPYVRDLGRGLVVIGGQEAYGMGSYGQTPMEQVLPVNMDLPKHRNLPSTAVVLIVESLEANLDVNISKQAAKGVVNLLTPEDQVGVEDANGGHFAVKLQRVTNKGAIDSSIDNMDPGDPESYIPDLEAAAQVLKGAKARIKHIILLGDGDAEDPGYQEVVQRIRGEGITVSTVATNGQGLSDLGTMEDIAHWGGGRYYRADSTASVPQIFLREARTVARSGIIPGKFYPEELSASPILRDFHAVPPLYGYVATTPKPSSELILVSKKLDPVLAAWQFGLGRSVAWTSDAAGLWTKSWLLAPGSQRFWANMVSWTLPTAQNSRLFVSTGSSQGSGQISVDTPAELGPNPAVTAHVLGPTLHAETVHLQPSAPGRYGGSFLANAQGAYFITVEAKGARHELAGQAGLAIPYSAEYRTTGTDLTYLRAVAVAGGGTLITQPSAAWADNLPPVAAPRSLTAWLLLLALLLLPIDIGIRRLVLTRSDLRAIWAALPFRSGRSRTAEPLVTPLGAVRARRSQTASPRYAPEASAPSAPIHLAAGLKARSPNVTAPTLTTPPSEPAPEEESSTPGRLLASKRRRRGE